MITYVISDSRLPIVCETGTLLSWLPPVNLLDPQLVVAKKVSQKDLLTAFYDWCECKDIKKIISERTADHPELTSYFMGWADTVSLIRSYGGDASVDITDDTSNT